MYVAIAGCTGNLPFVENADIHYAQSGIFTPADFSFSRDAIAAECNENIETIQIHDLDVELLRRHRETGSVQNWNDRRRDIYRVSYQDDLRIRRYPRRRRGRTCWFSCSAAVRLSGTTPTGSHF
jgi:hypothetical protein